MVFEDLVFRLIVLFAIISVVTYRVILLLMKGGFTKRITRKKQSIPFYFVHTGLIVSGWIAIIIYIINPAWISWATFSLPEWLRWIGVLWLFVNTILIIWAHLSLGYLFSINLEIYSGHQLIKQGLYSRIRHPMYTVLVMDWLAIILITANWLFLIAAIGAFFRVFHQTRLEETMMAEAFGDEFVAYRRLTGRFLPRFNRRPEK